MISSLSNLADRNFVLGYLLPVIMAALAAAAIFRDIPFVAGLWMAFASVDSFEKLTVALLCLWTTAVLLMAFNHQLYRFMEGYWGPFKWIAFFQKRQDKAFADDVAGIAALKQTSDTTYAALKAADAQAKLTPTQAAEEAAEKAKKASDAAWAAYWKGIRESRAKFPSKPTLVLPTMFGNVLRAFETYSLDVYGIDGIPGWLRLSGVIPESYQKLLDNARAEIDFFLNTCLLLAIIAVVALVAALTSALGVWNPLASPDLTNLEISWLLAAIEASILAFGCYRMALSRAPAWGDLVRSAFDLYLPNLAKQMGYVLPATPTERTKFWGGINGVFLYNDAVPAKYWTKAPAAVDDDKSG